MNPDALAEALLAVIAPLAEARREGSSAGLTAADFPLERPRNRDHGDWASNIAMRLAKPFGTNPRELAQQIATGMYPNIPAQETVDAADAFLADLPEDLHGLRRLVLEQRDATARAVRAQAVDAAYEVVRA